MSQSSTNRLWSDKRPCSLVQRGWLAAAWLALATCSSAAAQWPRHTIDNSSRGADGVRLADINDDGLPDVVTGWEEGGVVRVCFHPGSEAVQQTWPSITVGKAPSPEDAFAADLDADGRLDVVSCHEGGEQAIWFHWHPADGENWISQTIPASKNVTRWMYGFPMQIDNRHGVDLVIGSKGTENGMVAWLECPKDPRDVAAWKLHKIESATWIMSLEPADMNGDGRADVLVTDRKGDRRGVYWLQQTGEHGSTWQRHDIGLSDHEVMFAQLLTDPSSRDRIGVPKVWVSTRNNRLFELTSRSNRWYAQAFTNPFLATSGKAVAVARQPGGTILLAHTSNSAFSGVRHQQPAVAVTTVGGEAENRKMADWESVSGLEGTKFDRAEWIDLDQDGDLDLLTCEETDGLGVFWYEQP